MATTAKSRQGGRRWRPLSCFIGLALLTAPAVADVSAPELHRDRFGRFNVEAQVNGKGGFLFLVDTGASRTTVNRGLVAELGLKPYPKSLEIITATGPKEALVYPVATITAFGRTLRPGKMAALPEGPRDEAAGVLGIDLLRGTMIEFDVKAPAGRLLPSGSAPGKDGWVRIDGRPVGYGSLALEVVVNGVTIPAFVDTGAALSIFNPPAGKALGEASLARDGDGNLLKAQEVSAAGGRVAGRLRQVETLALGAHSVQGLRVTEADLPVFHLFGAEHFPAMILGMDILAKQDFAVDLGAWRLWIKAKAR